jgi:putative ATPase
MKDLGYGRDYVYPHADPDAPPQEFLPDALAGTRIYRPVASGFEAELARRYRAFLDRKAGRSGRSRGDDAPDGADDA